MVKKKQLSRKEITKVVIFIIVTTLIIFATVAFLVTRGSHAPAATDVSAEGEIDFTGLAVCLPHRNSGAVETMECQLGLKSDSGIYYSLSDTNKDYLNVGKLLPGKDYSVTGKLEERADTTYDSAGVIRVESIREL